MANFTIQAYILGVVFALIVIIYIITSNKKYKHKMNERLNIINKCNATDLKFKKSMKDDGIEFFVDEASGMFFIAKETSKVSTCLNKQWGAVLVKDHKVITLGSNCAPVGRKQCSIDIKKCWRRELEDAGTIVRGTSYDMCRSIHAEQFIIDNTDPKDLKGATLYLYGYDVLQKHIVDNAGPCPMCKRSIIDAGIKDVYIATSEERLGLTGDEFKMNYRVDNVINYVTNDDTLNITHIGY